MTQLAVVLLSEDGEATRDALGTVIERSLRYVLRGEIAVEVVHPPPGIQVALQGGAGLSREARVSAVRYALDACAQRKDLPVLVVRHLDGDRAWSDWLRAGDSDPAKALLAQFRAAVLLGLEEHARRAGVSCSRCPRRVVSMVPCWTSEAWFFQAFDHLEREVLPTLSITLRKHLAARIARWREDRAALDEEDFTGHQHGVHQGVNPGLATHFPCRRVDEAGASYHAFVLELRELSGLFSTPSDEEWEHDSDSG